MRLSHKKEKGLLIATIVASALMASGTTFAGKYNKPLTGWELSEYSIPDGADASQTGVEIIDSTEDAYEGRGALHIFSSGTQGNGYLSYAATDVDEFEDGKTYRFSCMIKVVATSTSAIRRPMLTLGDTEVVRSLASGIIDGQWHSVTKDFTFSGNAKDLRIQLWNTGDVYIDNVSLKEVSGDNVGDELFENVDFESDYVIVYSTPALIKDDVENIVVGITSDMEYSVDSGATWTVYDENTAPDLSGNVEIQIRYIDDPDKENHTMTMVFTENAIANGDFSVSLFDIIKNIFKTEGTLKGAENENVNIMLVREGMSKRSLENIILVSSFTTNENGEFSFEAPIADRRGTETNDGWYTMYLKSDDTEIHEFNKVYFASTDTRENAIELLKEGNTKQYFEKENEYYNTFKAVGFALSDYEKAGVDKTKAVSIFETAVTELGESLNEENAASEFSKSIFLAATGGNNETTMYELLKNHGDEFSFKYSDTIALEDVLNDGKAAAWVSKYFSMKKAQTSAEAEKMFGEAYALYLINNSTYGKMADVIKAQEAYLELSGSDYEKYMSLAGKKSNDAVTVSKHIVSKAAQSPFTDADMVLQAISEGVKKISKPHNGGNGGGGSGSGGGGTSSRPSSTSSRPGSTSSAGNVSLSTVKGTTVKEPYFIDLVGYSWAEEAVNTLFEKGIINGKATREFAPQDTVTRQEFVKMIVNITNSYDESAECEFADVDKGAWYYKYVASAVKKGLIQGVSEEEFGTDRNITREQIAVIINRVLNKTSDDIQNTFSDDDKIADYAKEAVYNVRKLGIISGYEDNTFRPANSATRAESAVICLNLLNKR